ncbi:MAG TPA: AbrB/MazE/SpoVT family DNA-binding domain-containing protein [Armatimonadota bacterium]|nr:AbrB/MazE/SpoVT family DNA-binding domain-containing protein [Armatimonadota bacterium]
MIKQLRKVGNSSALILDKAIMELIGLEENGKVQLVVSNGSLILTPVQPKSVSPQQFEQTLSGVIARRRGVLKRLAQ